MTGESIYMAGRTTKSEILLGDSCSKNLGCSVYTMVKSIWMFILFQEVIIYLMDLFYGQISSTTVGSIDRKMTALAVEPG